METQALNNTLDQMNITDIYRAFHPKGVEYIFFSSVHGIFSKVDHILDHKKSLSKSRKIEVISNIFSEHNTMWLKNNYKKKKKDKNTWMLGNRTLDNQWISEEIKEDIKKKYLEKNENENTTNQNLWKKA